MTGADAGNTLLAAALAYAARGWHVFPCHLDKSPATSHGVKDATTNAQQIRAWWTRRPDASIGIACGPSGLVVIDIDAGKGGFKSWAALKAAHGIDDRTTTSVTGGGGRHLIYRAPDGFRGRNSAGKLGVGLDVRADGGYIIAPPSKHPSGGVYTWAPQPSGPIPLPDGLRALLEHRAEAPTPRPPTAPSASAAPSRTHYAAAALRSECDALDRAVEGTRNDLLNRAAFRLGQLVAGGALDRTEVEQRLLAAAKKSGLDEWEARATIKSGLGAGAREPRGVPEPQPRPASAHAARSDAPPDWPDFAPTEEPARPTARAPEPAQNVAGMQKKSAAPTDDELVDRWWAARPDTAWGLGDFRRYVGGIWPIVPRDVIRKEIKAILVDAKAEGVRPTKHRLDSVLELARIDSAQLDAQWDANPDILICENGALHIPTRTLLPHDPEHWATTRLPYAYDPSARADTWLRVLDSFSAGERAFLQEFAGYTLTTDTKYELAIWLAGLPGSGKSTVLAGLLAMLGMRACLLGLSDIEHSRFALTNLPGKTLAYSTEQPVGYLTAIGTLNAIISGEPITVERKFREPQTIVSCAKVIWAMNELPRVGSASAGLFRRVKVLRCAPIPEDKRDPELKERVKQEGAGILNWALDGLDRLRQRGRFEVPASVQEATDIFKEINDIPAAFVAECCVTGSNPQSGRPYRVQGIILYKAYSDWCQTNGHKPLSSSSIAEEWRRLGFQNSKSQGKSYWSSVALAAAAIQVSASSEADSR